MRFGARSKGASSSPSSSLRIFFCTDVHGSDVCFRKFLNAGAFYQADVLILGGDITGKQLVPLKRERDGAVSCRFDGEVALARDEAELKALRARISDAGHYPLECDEEEVDRLRRDQSHRASVFERELLGRLRAWMTLADERLAGSGIRCLIQGGNDDFPECDGIIAASEHVEHPEDRVVELPGGWEIVSCGRANMTPWRCPRDVPEEELSTLITSMADRLQNPERAIFNLHCPPVETPLDEAPALDDTLKPRVGPGGMEMAHVGSSAVRQAIERYSPLLSLHGHIHESKGTVRIGRTTCVNPGSSYGEGVLQGALIDLYGDSIRSLTLIAG
jgi:Icc-related predicted phosphoesterase